ncbi:phage tail protein [Paenibacillus bouchesdurhonensis]|uniref:phage tail protein n=1 Tax=Paenibacillus bouchesdurhonensis TaxID=1870990 RepID=UPI000DA61431|nr:hypothetical protein [Paenibacillus bouchesdurhonensis]
MAVVKNLMVRAGADFSSMRKEMQKAQKSLDAFKSNVSIAVKGIVAALATIGVGGAIKDATKDAMQFEAAITQINRTLGSSAGAFRKWSKENASALGMSQLEMAKYGAIYSNLLSSFTGGMEETAQKTQDLLKASAVVAAATGRTMEDTMERIRSGLLGNTEAIEDLGINVNVAMIESTKAFQQFANGKSWQQLNFQTQQQIRLMAILEQANVKYGDTIASTTIARQNQFIAQLKNVKLALGQAFLPIYNAVLPALIRMATALATVMNYIAQFTTALFGGSVKTQQAQSKATNAQASAVAGLGDEYKKAGKSAEKAGKKAKGAIGSFDQLNLVGGTDSGGKKSKDDDDGIGDIGGAGGGLFGDLTDGMIDVSQEAQTMANRVRDAFSNTFNSLKSNWQNLMRSLYPSLQQAWSQIQPELEAWKLQFGKMFTDILSLGEPLKNWTLTGLIPNLRQGIELAGHVLAGLSESFRSVVGSLWEFAFPILDKFVQEGLPRLSEFADGVMSIFRGLFDLAKQIFDDIWKDAVDPAMQFVSKIIRDTLDIIFKWWDDWGGKIIDGLKRALDNIKQLWNNLWVNFLEPFVKNMLEMLQWLWDKHLKDLIAEIGNFIGKLITAATDIYNEFIMPIVNWLVKTLGPTWANMASFIGDVIGTALGVISDVAKGIIKSLGGIVDFVAGVFTGDWKRAWNGIQDFMGGFSDALVGIFKGAVNLIIDALNYMIRQVNKVKIDVPEWVPGIGGETLGFTVPEIPKLAKGALAFGPTLAVVGDNKGAAADPEVIAPLSKLQDYMDGGGDNPQTLSALNAILSAIKSGQNINVTISQRDVARAAINGINDETRRTGVIPITV